MEIWFRTNWRKVAYVAVLVLALVTVIYFFGLRPYQQVEGSKSLLQPKEVLELKNNIRTGLAQAIAGVVLLIGVYFTWKNISITQTNFIRTQEATREGQITERFARAVEHLGNNQSVAQRLGGIYSLERIARDSERDHWAVMEVLTNYLRHKSPAGTGDAPRASAKLRDDLQVILTVLGRRNLEHEKSSTQILSLASTELRSARFDDGVFGKLDLTQAHLEDASFQRCNMEEAILVGAHLSGANLERANLMKADFRFATLDEKTILSHAMLNDADFEQARLRGTKMEYASLERARFPFAIMEGVQLSNAVLIGALFRHTNLNHAVLYNAHLERAIAIDTNMDETILFDAKLTGARLERVSFRGAQGLDPEQLKSTLNCKDCLLPNEISAQTLETEKHNDNQ